MAYCYKYSFPGSDGACYIGKTSGDFNALEGRIRDHERDPKFENRRPKSGFSISYAKVPSPADADALETVLIALYKPVLNEAKMGWGDTVLFSYVASSIHWTPYAPIKQAPCWKGKKKSLPLPHERVRVFTCDRCGAQDVIEAESPATIKLEASDPFGAWYFNRGWFCRNCFEIALEDTRRLVFPERSGDNGEEV